jgi:hypothetical protein
LKIHGISEDVNLAGNVRLIGKARNISKSDSMPDANTEFFGKDNPELLLHFQAALAGFTECAHPQEGDVLSGNAGGLATARPVAS